jgi:hypothetical protein
MNMNLTNLLPLNRQELEKLIFDTASWFALLPNQIYQDLVAWLFLKTLTQLDDHPFVFRGGTSLSQSFQIIDRFSEDIDLSVFPLLKGYKFRRDIKQRILTVAKALGLEVMNIDDIQTDRNFNQYELGFTPFTLSEIPFKAQIMLEVMLPYPAYPLERRPVQNYIYRFLIYQKQFQSPIYEALKPFSTNVQAMERTFVDKIFALCDYHLKNEYYRQSRHLYDLHQMYHHPNFNHDVVKKLIPEVKLQRSLFPSTNPSAKLTVNLKEILHTIILKNVYLNDFEAITSSLITKTVTYKQCIGTLIQIKNTFF